MRLKQRIATVIVTYNRKELLLECIEALKPQWHLLHHVVLVDNGSIDGTKLALEQLDLFSDSKFQYERLGENIGGAGGFAWGMRKAIEFGCDWIWLMDDDTVPSCNALTYLLESLNKITDWPVGFLCSKVLWRDGQSHGMNLPYLKQFINNRAFNSIQEPSDFLIQSCSFVSALVSVKAVEKIGLPLKEMFIWGDDVEFFTRMTRSGFLGVYVGRSVVVHKTVENKNVNILNADVADLLKYKYGVRNELYNLKVVSYFSFIRKFLFNCLVLPFEIAFKRKDGRWRFVKSVWYSSLSSFFFHPSIDFVDATNSNE